MLKKIKRAIPAVISAILCVTMLLGVTASAASAWSEAKAIMNVKYNSNYIKWVEKYSEKETKSTISYGKSRTKKFLDKTVKAMSADEREYSLGIVSADRVMGISCKDDKFKFVLFDGSGFAFYIIEDELTFLSVDEKKMATFSADRSYGDSAEAMTADQSSGLAGIFDLGISENAKGKIFKFKSGDKIYYYEEFESDNFGEVGLLFSEKGTLLAMINKGDAFCVSFKTSVKDSEFDIPKGYTTVDLEDIDFSF